MNYFTLYRRAVSGPDIVIAYNIREALANYFTTYFPDDYRVVKQQDRIY